MSANSLALVFPDAVSSDEFPELKESKQRVFDHCEDCSVCRDRGESCDEGKVLLEQYLDVVRDCVRRKRQ